MDAIAERGRVIVVGAGVIGLSCAVRLAEAGYETHVMARELPLETASAAACGLWLLPQSQLTPDLMRWADRTVTELVRLAEDPDSGVTLATGTLLRRRAHPHRPPWAAVTGTELTVDEVFDPRPGYRSGWRARLPVIDPTRYLPWLVSRLLAAGGALTRMPLPALPPRGIVVNAAGVAARALARDWEVQPQRWQLALVDNPGLDEWWMADEDPAAPVFAIPRGAVVAVGGSVETGNWEPTPDLAAARRMLERAAAVEPALAGVRVRRHVVGLSPSRPSVRLEVAAGRQGSDRKLIHCYGHGNLGHATSWGCADEVLRKVEELDLPLF